MRYECYKPEDEAEIIKLEGDALYIALFNERLYWDSEYISEAIDFLTDTGGGVLAHFDYENDYYTKVEIIKLA